jgi:hypothetical protein
MVPGNILNDKTAAAQRREGNGHRDQRHNSDEKTILLSPKQPGNDQKIDRSQALAGDLTGKHPQGVFREPALRLLGKPILEFHRSLGS